MVYDPLYAHDAGHAKLIKKAAPEARMIRVPLRGHGVIHLTKGSSSTIGLFDAIFSDRYLDVVRMYRKRKRESWVYYYTMAAGLVHRCPSEVLRLIENDPRFKTIPIANRTQLVVAANARSGQAAKALSASVAYARKHPSDLKTPLKLLDAMLAHEAPLQAAAFVSALDEAGYQHPALDRTRRLVDQGLRRAKAKRPLAAVARLAPLAFISDLATAFLEGIDAGLVSYLT